MAWWQSHRLPDSPTKPFSFDETEPVADLTAAPGANAGLNGGSGERIELRG